MANLIRLKGMAKSRADVPCVLGRESANLFGLEGVAKGSADVPYLLGRESAILIRLEGVAKVIRDELCARYNEIERVNYLGTDRVEVGGVVLESGRILGESATNVVESAELFDQRICITDTALDWTKDGLREAQQCDTEIAPLLKWKETTQDGPERKDVLICWMTTLSYVQQWDDLQHVDGVLYRTLRSKEELHQYDQLVAPGGYQRALVRLLHGQGHFGVDRKCEQLRQRAYWYEWKNTVKTELGYCASCVQYFRGKPPRQAGLQPVVYGTPWGRVAIDITGIHPKSRNGYEYILTVMDYFTKWAEAYSIRDHKATTVASVLLENCFTQLGLPEEIICNQGTEFEGELFTELCKSLNISKLRTSPYRPSTN